MKRKLKHLSTGARFRLALGHEAHNLIGFTNHGSAVIEKNHGQMAILNSTDVWVLVIGHTKVNRRKIGVFTPKILN